MAVFAWSVVLVAALFYQLSSTRDMLGEHRSASFFQSTLMRDAREDLDGRMGEIRNTYQKVVDREDEKIKKEKEAIIREEVIIKIMESTNLKKEELKNKANEELVIILEELNTTKDE